MGTGWMAGGVQGGKEPEKSMLTPRCLVYVAEQKEEGPFPKWEARKEETFGERGQHRPAGVWEAEPGA